MLKMLCILLVTSGIASADKEKDDLRARLAASERARVFLESSRIDLLTQLNKLTVTGAARDKAAAANSQSNRLARGAAASAVTVAQDSAEQQKQATAAVQTTVDGTQLQMAQVQLQLATLKAASPINSVEVWMAAIAMIGTLATLFVSVINHGKLGSVSDGVGVVAKRVDGVMDHVASLAEGKGHSEGLAEGRAEK
jgi:hypothetical protein